MGQDHYCEHALLSVLCGRLHRFELTALKTFHYACVEGIAGKTYTVMPGLKALKPMYISLAKANYLANSEMKFVH